MGIGTRAEANRTAGWNENSKQAANQVHLEEKNVATNTMGMNGVTGRTTPIA
jgi:hypothetical protein